MNYRQARSRPGGLEVQFTGFRDTNGVILSRGLEGFVPVGRDSDHLARGDALGDVSPVVRLVFDGCYRYAIGNDEGTAFASLLRRADGVLGFASARPVQGLFRFANRVWFWLLSSCSDSTWTASAVCKSGRNRLILLGNS